MENKPKRSSDELFSSLTRRNNEPTKDPNDVSLNLNLTGNLLNKSHGTLLNNSLVNKANLRDSQTTAKKVKPKLLYNTRPLTRVVLDELLKNLNETDESEEESDSKATSTKNDVESKENNAPIPEIQVNGKPTEPPVVSTSLLSAKKPAITETNPSQKVDDSFELDFSVLSLTTPAKRKEKQDYFSTPNVMNMPKIQFSAKKEFGFPNLNPRPKNKSLLSIEETPKREQQTETTTKTNDENTNTLKVKGVEYQIMNVLGKGGSSVVYQCSCSKNNLKYAIKCVSLHDPLTAQGYINEVEILSKLQNCEKIIKMFDYEHLQKEHKMLMILEKGGEDLSTILKHFALRKSHISMHMLLFYWMEMLYAVREIHSHGIIHNDLKPANFIQAEGCLKLIDFGIARCVQLDNTCVIKSNPEGSCNYISPEAVKGETSSNINSPSYGKNKYKLNYKSDIWSLGCILYQLVYRRPPFHHISQLWQKLFAIVNPKHEIYYPDAPWVPIKIINTIQQCLKFDKNSRPSVNELISEYENSLLNLS